jgi:hypothetical protein
LASKWHLFLLADCGFECIFYLKIIAEVHRCTEELMSGSNGWGPSSVEGNGLGVGRSNGRLPRLLSPTNGPIVKTALHLPQQQKERNKQKAKQMSTSTLEVINNKSQLL